MHKKGPWKILWSPWKVFYDVLEFFIWKSVGTMNYKLYNIKWHRKIHTNINLDSFLIIKSIFVFFLALGRGFITKSATQTDWIHSTIRQRSQLPRRVLGGRYSRNEISHNLWLWLKGHIFSSLISVFGEEGPNKFSHKGNLLAFGGVASASAHPGVTCVPGQLLLSCQHCFFKPTIFITDRVVK